jgi:hypothetical protein
LVVAVAVKAETDKISSKYFISLSRALCVDSVKIIDLEIPPYKR